LVGASSPSPPTRPLIWGRTSREVPWHTSARVALGPRTQHLILRIAHMPGGSQVDRTEQKSGAANLLLHGAPPHLLRRAEIDGRRVLGDGLLQFLLASAGAPRH
jgi:hypothetical protein